MVWNIQRQTDAVRPFSFCTPTLIRADGADQLITPGSDVVQSLDPATGGELWRVRYSGFSVVPRPLYESGLVFISTGFMEAKLMAIDPTGRGDVTDTHVKWSTKTGVPKTSSFVANNGQLIMVSDKGVISSLDALSGKELWKKRVGGDFSSSLLLAKQNLYAFDELGQCSVLDIAGSQPDVIATNHLNERTLSSPAVVANDLLIRTDKALYRIGQK
jgi:outer membrane protein assembly factor BamB